jgi:hypothetical protein
MAIRLEGSSSSIQRVLEERRLHLPRVKDAKSNIAKHGYNVFTGDYERERECPIGIMC